MKKNLLHFLFAVFAIGIIALLASCIKEAPENEPVDEPEFSHVVTIDDAQTELEGILSDIEAAATRSGEVVTPRKIASRHSTGSPVATRAGEDGEDIEPYVHIFNFEDNAGFAIMSGDDRVTPLLALTLEGELTTETEIDNPGLIVCLANMEDYYRNELQKPETLIDETEPGFRVEYGEWTTSYYGGIGGRCKVKWGQRAPYNNYCPVHDGKRTLTGCVATAVAQLMSIHKHPASYGGYSFFWNFITEDIAPADPSAAANYIARLMQQLGLFGNLNMSYGLSSSSAEPKYIPQTLRNFGFSCGGSLKGYDTGTVAGELRAGWPVLIGGYQTRTHNTTYIVFGIPISYYTYSGGHRWLAHGLLDRERTVTVYNGYNILIEQTIERMCYPLCNFGWNGDSDGYYLSNAFNLNRDPYTRSDSGNEEGESTTTPNNYQFDVTAVTGIRK